MVDIDSIRKRLVSKPFGDMTSMQSACGEYECDCHRDMPVVLDELEKIRQEKKDLIRVLNHAIHGGCVWKKGSDMVEAENLVDAVS